jgi:MtN3 and saliva related transmembrane protein
MEISFFVGLLAGVLTTIGFLPQVIKAFKTKHTKDLSFPTFLLLSVGIILWFVYGILIREIPIILANTVALVLIVFILVMKARYG